MQPIRCIEEYIHITPSDINGPTMSYLVSIPSSTIEIVTFRTTEAEFGCSLLADRTSSTLPCSKKPVAKFSIALIF
jgi:hypothetical protein